QGPPPRTRSRVPRIPSSAPPGSRRSSAVASPRGATRSRGTLRGWAWDDRRGRLVPGMPMKVLVTGVTGFLGGRLAEGLAARGHDVRGFARDPRRWTARPAGAEVAQGDMTDPASIRRAACGRDAIVHAAALVKVWVKDKGAFDRVTVDGLRHLLAAAAEERARVFYTSSFLALGPTDGTTFDEETPRATAFAHNDYERTKWA